MTEGQVRKLLRSAINKAGGLRAFCREHELDPGLVSRVNDGAKLAPAILAALVVEESGSVTTYRYRGKR